MFTKKDRKIANQKAMIENRDKFIEKLTKEMQTIREKNDELNKENTAVYKENRDLRFEIDEKDDLLKEILKLAEGNTYNNDKIVLSKIIEVIRRQTK